MKNFLMKINVKSCSSIFLILFMSVFYISCDYPFVPETVKPHTSEKSQVNEEIEESEEPEEIEEVEEIIDLVTPEIPEIVNRKWNILFYMSADNNLESSALEDIVEIELSKINTNEISIFALIDRSESYDTSENNWSGTRLYKIKTNRSVEEKNMISEEIECPPLSLIQGQNTELDLSNGYVLSKCLDFIMEKFPADDYGFVMWGHGTGWRSENSHDSNFNSTNMETFKGFAFDESSKTYMTLKQLGIALKNGLNGRKLSFLGFDTCFGGELEILYELKDYSNYCVASEGLVMSNGWNYTNLFNEFSQTEKKSEELCECVINQFENQYGNTKRASIVAVDMSEIENYVFAFDDFTKKAAQQITSKQERNNVLGILYSNNDCKTERYSYGADNSDVYVDSFSMCSQLYKHFGKKLEDEYIVLQNAKEKCIVQNWSSDSITGGIGVYFSSLASSGSNIELLSTTFPSTYIKGKTYDQIKFVIDSKGYVPTMSKNESLLDKIFYTDYN